jgi:hypothetical protein
MSLMSFLRGVVGAEEPTTYVEGTIVDGPDQVDGDGTSNRTVVFRLDTCPEIRFRQVLSALAPERRRGERVRVHYRMAGPIADVQWLERI